MRLQAANAQTEAKKIPGYLPVTSTQLSSFSHGLLQPVLDSGAGMVLTCLRGAGKLSDDWIAGKDGQQTCKGKTELKKNNEFWVSLETHRSQSNNTFL